MVYNRITGKIPRLGHFFAKLFFTQTFQPQYKSNLLEIAVPLLEVLYIFFLIAANPRNESLKVQATISSPVPDLTRL